MPAKGYATELEEIVAERSVLICCGSGGVGKTTTSAAIALAAAMSGRRTCVVTIDPARRLANALGIEGLTNTPKQIAIGTPAPASTPRERPVDVRVEAGRSASEVGGELWAMMLDTKATFDDLVRRYAGSSEQVERILANRIYKELSSALSGTQEYMAMEKLYELVEEGGYDLVVVDTPPTRNALDFLEAPSRLIRFLEHRLFRLVLMPTRMYLRAVSVATQAFVRTVSKVAGAEILDDAVTFFQAFDGMEEGFHARADRMDSLMRDPDTAFVLVTTPRPEAIDEAGWFTNRLDQYGIEIQALVANRVHPVFLPAGTDVTIDDLNGVADRLEARDAAGAKTATGADTKREGDWAARMEAAALIRNLSNYELVARRDQKAVSALGSRMSPSSVTSVPLLTEDVHDLQGLHRLAGLLAPGC